MTALFLSLRPNFARLILSGEKTVEVRRIIPRAATPGTLVLVYESAPVKAWSGICFYDGLSTGRPETIWRKLGTKTGLKKQDFVTYLEGAETAVALHISKPVPFSRPVSLAEIRGTWRSFQPPQSFQYVGLRDVEALARSLRPVVGEETLTGCISLDPVEGA